MKQTIKDVEVVDINADRVKELQNQVTEKDALIEKLRSENQALMKDNARYKNSANSAKMLLHDFIEKL